MIRSVILFQLHCVCEFTYNAYFSFYVFSGAKLCIEPISILKVLHTVFYINVASVCKKLKII